MNNTRLSVICILIICIMIGCSSLEDSNNDNGWESSELFDIVTVEGSANDYDLTYSSEEVIPMLLDKMTTLGMISPSDSICFVADNTIHTINGTGYFYFVWTYDKQQADSNEYITATGRFYIDGNTGQIYQFQIDENAKTMFTKL